MNELEQLVEARQVEMDAILEAQINDDDTAFDRHSKRYEMLSRQIENLKKFNSEEEERKARLDLAEREFQEKQTNNSETLRLKEKQGNKDLAASFGRTAFGAVCTAGLTWLLRDVEKESILSAKPFGFVSDFKKKFM